MRISGVSTSLRDDLDLPMLSPTSSNR